MSLCGVGYMDQRTYSHLNLAFAYASFKKLFSAENLLCSEWQVASICGFVWSSIEGVTWRLEFRQPSNWRGILIICTSYCQTRLYSYAIAKTFTWESTWCEGFRKVGNIKFLVLKKIFHLNSLQKVYLLSGQYIDLLEQFPRNQNFCFSMYVSLTLIGCYKDFSFPSNPKSVFSLCYASLVAENLCFGLCIC